MGTALLGDPLTLLDVLEVEVISLWLLSWMSSFATSWLRASCRSAARLAPRHGPVCSTEIVYFEGVERPDISAKLRSPEESVHMNPFSPLRSWGLGLTVCRRLGGSDYAQAAFARLFGDRSFVLALAAEDGYAALSCGEFRSDRAIVMVAVRQNGYALERADESFKSDRDVVLAAATSHGHALQFAERSLKQDKDLVLRAVTEDAEALQFAHASLRHDKDIVLAASLGNDDDRHDDLALL